MILKFHERYHQLICTFFQLCQIDYEEQLLQLRIEKKNLAAELNEWKSKILFQQVDLIKR
jgi:hypothetical protein